MSALSLIPLYTQKYTLTHTPVKAFSSVTDSSDGGEDKPD